jgi:hypothetical protein
MSKYSITDSECPQNYSLVQNKNDCLLSGLTTRFENNQCVVLKNDKSVGMLCQYNSDNTYVDTDLSKDNDCEYVETIECLYDKEGPPTITATPENTAFR